MRLLWIALFGLAGVFSRYFTDEFASRFPGPFPVGTFGINILGSFLAGVLYAWGVERSALPTELRVGILVGFLGGFTTFSSYSLQAARLVESSSTFALGIAYLAASPVLGMLASLGGLNLVRWAAR